MSLKQAMSWIHVYFISWRKRSFSEMSIFSLFSRWKHPFKNSGTDADRGHNKGDNYYEGQRLRMVALLPVPGPPRQRGGMQITYIKKEVQNTLLQPIQMLHSQIVSKFICSLHVFLLFSTGNLYSELQEPLTNCLWFEWPILRSFFYANKDHVAWGSFRIFA